MNGIMSVAGFAQDGLGYGLTLALYATFCAAPLAGIVLVINLAHRRWLTAGQVCLLWSIVLLRLMLPVAPSSVLSLQNLQQFSRRLTAIDNEQFFYSADEPATESNRAPLTSGGAPEALDLQTGSPAQAESASSFDWVVLIYSVPWIWFFTGGTLLICTIVAHRRFCRIVKSAPDCQDPNICRLWQECCAQVKLQASIPVKLLDAVDQPALLGFLRPKLLLPIDATHWNDRQLRMVMLHELAHGKRWDVAMNWALLLIGAVHWWNPLYWLAASRVRSLREQACDAFALLHMEGATRLSYGELLLDLAARPQSASAWKVMLPVSIVGFFSSYWRKRAITRRIKALRFSAKPGRAFSLTGAALIAFMACTGLTDANSRYADDIEDRDWFLLMANQYQWSLEVEKTQDSSPTLTRAYSVEKALARISRDGEIDDNARNELKLHLSHTLNGLTSRGATTSLDWAQKQFRLEGTTLTLNATSKIHAEIAKNLAAWEQSGWGQTSLETRFVRYEHDLAGKLGLSWQSLVAVSGESSEKDSLESGLAFAQGLTSIEDYLPVALTKLNDDQVALLMNRVQGDRRSWIMQTPKITTFNGQQVSCRGCMRLSFPVGARDGGQGKQPLPALAEIENGLRLTFRAVQSSDGKNVHLESRIDLTHVQDAYPVSTQVGNDRVRLLIPRMNRRRIAVASDLEDGQSLLIGYFPTREQKGFLYVLLTPRVILDEDIEAQ